MKFLEAMIAYDCHSDRIKVGTWPDTTGWSDRPRRYDMTGGACFGAYRTFDRDRLIAQLFIDFHMIVVRDGVPIAAVHREFLKIDEYRECISPDIPGAARAA